MNRVVMCLIFLNLAAVSYLKASSLENLKNRYGEHAIIKSFTQRSVGPTIILKNEVYHTSEKNANVTFIIEVAQADVYYLTLFLCERKNAEISLSVDHSVIGQGICAPTTDGWQSVVVKDTKNNSEWSLYLSRGEHTLTFSSAQECRAPEIDDLLFGKSIEKSTFSDRSHKIFISWYKQLKNKTIAFDYKQAKKSGSLIEELRTASPAVTSDEPFYKYQAYLNRPYTYTYHGNYFLQSGQTAVFETRNPLPLMTDPVLYLYSQTDPVNYSWCDDDGGGASQSRISATITKTGYYTLLVRSYSPHSRGTVSIYQNNTLMQTGAVAAGELLYVDPTITTGVRNYFTADPNRTSPYSRDTYLCLARGFTSPFVAFNDDYLQKGGGDFNFGYFSRIKVTSGTILYGFVCAFSIKENNSLCDIYLGCEMSDITVWFENLKKDDAIKSSDASFDYNCISWSGGITSDWWWPPSYSGGGPYFVKGNAMQSFDNFYGNISANGTSLPRYPYAETFTRTGATADNAVIDLWAIEGSYTHASCRRNANGHMHGYDWESKPGSTARTFHPRSALQGESYGEIVDAYTRPAQRSNTLDAPSLTEKESIERGLLTVVDKEVFSPEELAKIEKLIGKVSKADKDTFETCTRNLEMVPGKDTLIALQSNPIFYQSTDEYKKFLKLCKKLKEKALPLIFKRLAATNNFIYLILIEELAFKEYGAVYDDVVNNQINRRLGADEKPIQYSNKNTMMKFAKKLVNDYL
ncbi:MAG: hypothetical protein JW795_22230 [Chitinivibrionales bacterium]|nr:hypothetical protein [Chitinivibrionales bacterium]